MKVNQSIRFLMEVQCWWVMTKIPNLSSVVMVVKSWYLIFVILGISVIRDVTEIICQLNIRMKVSCPTLNILKIGWKFLFISWVSPGYEEFVALWVQMLVFWSGLPVTPKDVFICLVRMWRYCKQGLMSLVSERT